MTTKPFFALITPVGDGCVPPGGGAPGTPPGVPTHPIFYPPGVWPGPNPPYVDIGGPAPQPGPGRPTHPIYYPPVIWDPSRPTNPIANPGDPNNPGGEGGEGETTPPVAPLIDWKVAWSPNTGWIVVGVPTFTHATPSEDEPVNPTPVP